MIYAHPLWMIPALLAAAFIVCAVLLKDNR